MPRDAFAPRAPSVLELDALPRVCRVKQRPLPGPDVPHLVAHAVGRLVPDSTSWEMKAGHGEMIAGQLEMIARHGEMIARHLEMIARHGEMIASHWEMIASHG